VRFGVAIQPFFASLTLNTYLEDNTDLETKNEVETSLKKNLIIMVVYQVLFFGCLVAPLGILPWDSVNWFFNFFAIVNILPNIVQKICLLTMSSYSHYYLDIPKNNAFYQNQFLNSPIFYPMQIFCVNFGATHILHHYFAQQPWYIRSIVYYHVLEPMKTEG
jgi:hypothetical protein